ncbi:hypothetical protein GOP47_0015528 [Adiantum capillus-veneris]|uniref:Uncharacterized protein n=1 Tax=Adiantum capillus-veneris TaxID=13818 RepID=A0A9D4UK62_ADICA|nr:hypothetical protein GOP47_0015528 [Adiantum capillus-veneris]
MGVGRGKAPVARVPWGGGPGWTTLLCMSNVDHPMFLEPRRQRSHSQRCKKLCFVSGKDTVLELWRSLDQGLLAWCGEQARLTKFGGYYTIVKPFMMERLTVMDNNIRKIPKKDCLVIWLTQTGIVCRLQSWCLMLEGLGS